MRTDITPPQYEQDPRPDLTSDTVLWVALLTMAKKESEYVFGMLHCLRCCGAGLVEDARSGFRIVPGEWDAGEYAKYRDNYIRPSAVAIKALLAKAATAPVAPRAQAAVPSLTGWPEDAVAFEKRHGYPARLYYYINKMVPTPRGEARLLQVFQDRVTVHVLGDTQATNYPTDVISAHLSQVITTVKKEAR